MGGHPVIGHGGSSVGGPIVTLRTPLHRMLGDTDGNGAMDAADAVLVLRAVVDAVTLTGAEAYRGDIDQNRSVDMADAVGILCSVVGY